MSGHTPQDWPLQASDELPLLNRQLLNSPEPAPVRMVHLGLGAFHRSHQAWYTHRASDAAQWGIASFSGRRPDAADLLAAQDGVYTLVERSEEHDSFEPITSIVEAIDGANLHRLKELIASPMTALVTLTITEAAYSLDELDESRALESSTPLGRLVLALSARREAGGGPIAVVSCDNLAHNGQVTKEAVLALAKWPSGQTGSFAGLAEWITDNVSFVSTSVDRITPRTTAADLEAAAAATGYRDEAAVVTEPFHNWILSGSFPAGRPRWEDAGAIFVDDIEPYENRKLWLLNGAHSILAYTGLSRGHGTVAAALADHTCKLAVEQFWDEAERHLPSSLCVPDYRAALLRRFSNNRIAHHLTQIAADGSTKLRMRALPVLRAERAAQRAGSGASLMIAAWIAYVSSTAELQDPLATEIQEATSLSSENQTAAMLSLLSSELAQDDALASQITQQLESINPTATHAGR
ncbi:mannitol dehydrogenase family protein [Paenarthrobacter aromaticivorans]|uniref:mannitol dehydrogenase family protein n=1 Tax=Paenarthrobacter aromaticivorans TaxID=2849150 RepID=UPI003A7F970B